MPDCLACEDPGPHKLTEQLGDPGENRETFHYWQCAACGTFFIQAVPDNLGDYYPKDYYSYTATSPPKGLRGVVKRLRDRAILCGAGPFSPLLRALPTNEVILQHRSPFDGSGPRRYGPSARIIDIGCGYGRPLREMRAAGFRSLLGVDPYMPEEVDLPGLQLRKCTLDDVEGEYDVLMMHHSLEHVRDPRSALRKLRTLAAAGSMALIRIPLAGSAAHEMFGQDWYGFDAPRHLVMFTREGFERAARDAGWDLLEVRYDSTGAQFYASIMRQRGFSVHTHLWEGLAGFSDAERAQFEHEAETLNAAELGDQAAFFLAPA